MSKTRCKHCKALVDKRDTYRTGMQTFCSIEHYKEYFTGSRKTKTKPVPDWATISSKIRLLDGGKCRVCGTRSNLQIHHIIYRGQPGCTNGPENLITLCLEHHGLVHSNKKLYQPRLFDLVKKRAQGDKLSRIKIGE